jgi:hypothetical protein
MKKFKVNIDREKISSEEIASRRDFDAVLKGFTAAAPATVSKPFYKTAGFAIGSAVVVLSAAVTLWYAANYTDWLGGEEKSSKPVAEEFGAAPQQPQQNTTAAAFINPPFENLDIEYTSYKVNAGKGGELSHHTGSKIKVPAGAFADENGNAITGEVELRYREFHDPADFFVSGIPMTYDSAGTQYHFESAGMMEMIAYRDGKPLKMQKGKEIEVEIRSAYEGSRYNLYELDTAARNWVYKGKDKVKKKEKNAGNDHTSFDEPSNVAIKMIDKDKQAEQEKELEKINKEITVIKKDIAKIEREKPQEPRKADAGRYKFNIEVDPSEFPEIALYKGMLFEVGDENKNFTKDMYKIEWDDVSLAEGTKKGVNYQMTLTKGEKKQNFIVYPVLSGKDYEVALNEYKQKFKDYQVTLDKRKADEKKKEEEYKALVKKMEDERKEQEAKWQAQQQAMQQGMLSASTTFEVFRVFRVDKFGVWNSDCPGKMPSGNTVAAKFQDKSGNDLAVYDVFLIDKSKNGVYVYHSDKHDKLEYDPKSKNLLWTVTADNKLAVFSESDFASVPGKKGDYTFKMDVTENKFKNMEELKEFLLKN